jgi:hypothetical protein
MKSSPFECDTYPSTGTAVHCFISWGSTHSGVWPLGPLGSWHYESTSLKNLPCVSGPTGMRIPCRIWNLMFLLSLWIWDDGAWLLSLFGAGVSRDSRGVTKLDASPNVRYLWVLSPTSCILTLRRRFTLVTPITTLQFSIRFAGSSRWRVAGMWANDLATGIICQVWGSPQCREVVVWRW